MTSFTKLNKEFRDPLLWDVLVLIWVLRSLTIRGVMLHKILNIEPTMAEGTRKNLNIWAIYDRRGTWKKLNIRRVGIGKNLYIEVYNYNKRVTWKKIQLSRYIHMIRVKHGKILTFEIYMIKELGKLPTIIFGKRWDTKIFKNFPHRTGFLLNLNLN